MYNSNVAISSLIEQIESEADVITQIEDEFYLKWVNIVQQTLYKELIEQYSHSEVETDGDLYLDDIEVTSEQAPVEYDDIFKIYIDGEELTKASVTTAFTIPDKDIYYYDSANSVVRIRCKIPYDKINVVYRVRPKIAEETSEYIYLPYEWLEMLAAKIRGELYKIANDDVMAAKWLADYNTQLESFKVWIMKRNSRYGE